MSEIVPIALFAYARPEHLKKVLNSLKINQVPLIYAFCDGPKDLLVESDVCLVRKILREVDWCEIKIIEQSKNLGLGQSVRQGVSDVLAEYQNVIVVEDDIVFRPGAYEYVVKAIEQYLPKSEVMTISMWSDPILADTTTAAGFFSKRFVCWGWATNREAWATYTGTPVELYQKCLDQNLSVLDWGSDVLWQVEHARDRDLWYVGFLLCHFLHNGLSYFPKESLIENIGFDASSTNTGKSTGTKNYQPKATIEIPQNWPAVNLEDNLAAKFCTIFNLRQKSAKQKISIMMVKILNLLYIPPLWALEIPLFGFMIKLSHYLNNKHRFRGSKISYSVLIDRKSKIGKDNLLRESSTIKNCELGYNISISPSVMLNDCQCAGNNKIQSDVKLTKVQLDQYSYIAERTTINWAKIGKFCSIGAGVRITIGSHPAGYISTSPVFYSPLKQAGITFTKETCFKERKGFVLGNDVWIGNNVLVVDGVRVGNGAIIAGGATVVEDVPAYAVVGGVPAKILKYRFQPEQIQALEEMQWWNWSEEKLKEAQPLFASDKIDGFIAWGKDHK